MSSYTEEQKALLVRIYNHMCEELVCEMELDVDDRSTADELCDLDLIGLRHAEDGTLMAGTLMAGTLMAGLTIYGERVAWDLLGL
jgi:hypothetical protein